MTFTTQLHPLDIPLIVDAICEHLNLKDILHCRQVSTAWFTYFNPYRWRTVKFVDLSEKHTNEILQNTPRIHALAVDLRDPDLFITNPYSKQCIQLTELHCTDFGYMLNTPCQPHNPRTNALFLLETNPKLEKLEIERPAAAVFDYFVPCIISWLSRHSCLTTLRINGLYADSIKDVLSHLPLSIQDVDIRLSADWTETMPPPDLNSSLSPVNIPTTFEDRFKQGRVYTRLTRFHLHITWATSIAFSSFLKLCPQVQDLYLPQSVIGGSIQYLATVLEHCPKLLSSCQQDLLWEAHLHPEDDMALFRTLRSTFLSRILRLDLVIGENTDQGVDVLGAIKDLMDAADRSLPLEVLNLTYKVGWWSRDLDMGACTLACLPNLRQFSCTGYGSTNSSPFQQHPKTVSVGQYLQDTTSYHYDINLRSPRGLTSTRWSRREQSKAPFMNIPLRIHGYMQKWSDFHLFSYEGEVNLQDLVESPRWISHNLQRLQLRIMDSHLLRWDVSLPEPKQEQITRISKMVYQLFQRLHAHAARDPQTGALALQLSLTWASSSFQFPLETGLQAMWAQGLFGSEDDDDKGEEYLPMTEADAAWMCLPWPTLAEVHQIAHKQQLTHVASTSQREPPKPTQSQSSILSYSVRGWHHPCSHDGRYYHHDGCELNEDLTCAEVDVFSLPYDEYMNFSEKVPDHQPRLQRQLEELEDRFWCTNTKKYRKFGATHHRQRLSSWIEYERE